MKEDRGMVSLCQEEDLEGFLRQSPSHLLEASEKPRGAQ